MSKENILVRIAATSKFKPKHVRQMHRKVTDGSPGSLRSKDMFGNHIPGDNLQLYPQVYHYTAFGNTMDITFFKVKGQGNPRICRSNPPQSDMDIHSTVDIRTDSRGFQMCPKSSR